MDAQLLTLSKIFTERLFRIPDYQRGYAWADKQLKDFWTDIQQLEENRNHYTGVLTLESVPEKIYRTWEDDSWIIDAKSYQPFFVVDGQQRLTTAMILIQVILECMQPEGKLNYTDKTEIQRKFIFDSKDSGISRSYVFGYEKDNPSYEYLKTKIYCERSSSAVYQETTYTQNLIQAKDFFADRVKELTSNQLEILYKKVTQHLLFNIFTITDDVDVCVAFETMNNRGKPLSYLELLKNRLIYISLKFEADEEERGALRRAINDCWKAIYHNLGRNKDKPLPDDSFLFTHYNIYFGMSSLKDHDDDIPLRYRHFDREDYAEELLEKRFIAKNVFSSADAKAKIELVDVYKYVSSLQESVEVWYKMLNPFHSDLDPDTQIWLDKVNRVGMGGFQGFLLAFFQKIVDVNRRVNLLQALERYLFMRSLSYSRYQVIGFSDFNIQPKLFVELNSGRPSTEKMTRIIIDAINDILKNNTFIKEISDRFRVNGFYEWVGIRYFLFEYNLDLQKHSKTERPKIYWPEFNEGKTDFISVEHIYPQQARHQYWTSLFKGLTQKQRTTLRNSLGNLLPLSKPKNSSLSNKPFPEKVRGKEGSSIGYQFGCYAENEVSLVPEWTPKEILKRGQKMLKFMESRWGIELGDDRQKKIILGVEFVK